MLLIPILILFLIGIIYLIFKIVIPYRENIRKETYKRALQEFEAEKRKKKKG